MVGTTCPASVATSSRSAGSASKNGERGQVGLQLFASGDPRRGSRPAWSAGRQVHIEWTSSAAARRNATIVPCRGSCASTVTSSGCRIGVRAHQQGPAEPFRQMDLLRDPMWTFGAALLDRRNSCRCARALQAHDMGSDGRLASGTFTGSGGVPPWCRGVRSRLVSRVDTALASGHDARGTVLDRQGPVAEGGSRPVQVRAMATIAVAIVGVVSLKRARAHAAPDEEAAST